MNANRRAWIILIILLVGCGGSTKTKTSLTPEEYRKLREFKPVGLYAGFNAEKGVYYIGNELVERHILFDIDNEGISTVAFINKRAQSNYITAPSDEFQFDIGSVRFSGHNGQLKYFSHDITKLPGGIRQLNIVLQYKDSEGHALLNTHVKYEIYPNQAVIRKWLEFENLSDAAIVVENLQIERLEWIGRAKDTVKFSGHLLNRNISIPYSGGVDDPIIVGFQPERREGFILGNEASGVCKYFELYTSGDTISVGLTPNGQQWRTEIRVPAGETVASPQTFLLVFTDSDVQQTLHNELNRFMQKHANLSANMRETEQSVYLMDISPESQTQEETPGEDVNLVCVDYDWQQSPPEVSNNHGDDLNHSENRSNDFSHSEILLELSRSLHAASMKFGLRINLAAVKQGNPIAVRNEWAFKPPNDTYWTVDVNGEPAKIFCLASDYGMYIAQAIADLIIQLDNATGYRGEYHPVVVDYLILDMPAIGSAEQSIYGCGAYGHEHYSRPESIKKIYERLFEIADFLHQKYPDLVVCVSPRLYGTPVPDLALLAHIDQLLVFNEPGYPQMNELTTFLPRNTLLEVWSKKTESRKAGKPESQK